MRALVELALDTYGRLDAACNNATDGPAPSPLADIPVDGDTAVSIGLQRQEAAFQGSPSNGTFRITHVWVRTGDRWSIAAMHLSPVGAFAPPAAAPRA
jgi:ketosteroid isomerase-like protein